MRRILFLVLLCMGGLLPLFGEEAISTVIVETRDFPEVKLTQLRLSNGMTIWLKPTDFEHDEIFIKLAALGGYGSLPAGDRPSGELAASIAWESGMGDMTSDQVSVLLYENSLEFAPKIHTFHRSIEGVSGKEGLEAFLQCVKMVFTQQKFTKEGLKTALANARNILAKLACDYDYVYEAMFLNINSQGVKALQPLSTNDLSKVKLLVAKDFFQRAYSDPSEFVCVFVGSIDIEKTKALIVKYLGTIPKKAVPTNMVQTFNEVFPKGITEREIKLPKRLDSLTRITFPWKRVMDEKKIYKMGFTCQVIEARLRKVITEKMKLSYGIDVSYEFPFYPFLEDPWMSIRFRCDLNRVETIKQLILAELKHLQEKGVSGEEIEGIKYLEAGSDEFWLHDNFYWMSMLTNYYLWKWDPQWIYRASVLTQDLTPEKIHHLLKTGFSLENYSVITAKP